MSEPYPPEVYDHLERAINDALALDFINDPEVQRLEKICLEEGLTNWESSEEQQSHQFSDGKHYEVMIPHPESYRVTGKGDLALRRYKKKPESKKKGGTVNQRMAEMLLADATLIELSATQWAVKLGDCTDGAVKQTPTWKKICDTRRAYEAERAARDKGKSR